MKENLEIRETRCPVCGKIYIKAPYHIYKSKGRFVCSWTCMLKSEGKAEKEELEYEPIGKERINNQSKRYMVIAKREENDEWSTWTEVDDLDKALHHSERCRELGYISKINEMPIETYLNRGARKAFEALQGYIAENKIQISNENLDSVLKDVLKEITTKAR